MWMIVHTLSGGALGAVLGVWAGLPGWVVVLVALAAHALLDLVPHWDYTDDRRRVLWALLDLGISVAAAGLGWRQLGLPPVVLAAAAASAAPDLDVVDVLLPFRRSLRVFPSHWNAFPHGHCRRGPGVAVQAVVAGLCILVVSGLR
ncbi:MAG: hypothetical protein Kow00122_15890 [Thermoleophilia bacterium]